MPDRTVVVRLRAEAGQLYATLAKASASINATGDSVTKVARQHQAAARTIGIAALAIGAGIAVGFGVAIKRAADLEASMHNVASLAPDVQRNFSEMTNAVIDMSTTLPQTAQELADAMYNVASSGFQGAEALKIVEAAGVAASAGLTSAETSAKAITAVINAYGLAADDATDVSDSLFETVNLGVLEFDDLAQNIGDVVGIGSVMKVNIDELGQAIATLTRGGIVPAEAFTALKGLIVSFLKPSESLTEVLRKLGYESGTAAIKQDGLHDVMLKVWNATGQNVAAFGDLFPNVRALNAAVTLVAQNGRNYNEVVGAWEGKNGKAGASARVLAEQQKSLNTQIQLAKNAVDALALRLGTALLPAIKFLVGALHTVVDWFDKLPGPIKIGIAAITALLGVVALLSGAFLLLAPKLNEAHKLFVKLPENVQAGTRGFGKFVGAAAGAAAILAILPPLLHEVGVEGEAAGAATGAAAGAMLGSFGGPPGVIIGAGIGTIAGALGLLGSNAKSAEEETQDLMKALEGLNARQAARTFVTSAAVNRGTRFDPLPEFRRIAKESPAQAAIILEGLHRIGAGWVGGERNFRKFEKALQDGAVTFDKHDAAVNSVTEANKKLLDSTDPATAAMNLLGGAADGATDSITAAQKSVNDLTDATMEAGNPLLAYQSAVSAWKDKNKTDTEEAGQAWWHFADTAKMGLQSFLDELNKQTFAVLTFKSNLLRIAATFGPDVAQTIIDMGPEAGAALAQALVDAPQEQWASIIETFKANAKATGEAGNAEFKLQFDAIKITNELGADASVQAIITKLNERYPEAIQTAQKYGTRMIAVGNQTILLFGGKAYTPASLNWGAGGTPFGNFARGGVEDHHAQLARGGDWRVWAEPETGGEAYIPLTSDPRQRGRSMGLLAQVANMFGATLFPFQGGGAWGLVPAFADAVSKWITAGGNSYNVVSGGRSRAEQTELYRRYLAGTGNLAAAPGTSKHEVGLAVDMGGNLGRATPLAMQFQIVPGRVRGEPWHFEWGGPGGGVGGGFMTSLAITLEDALNRVPKPPQFAPGMPGAEGAAMANAMYIIGKFSMIKKYREAEEALAAQNAAAMSVGGGAAPGNVQDWITQAVAATGVPQSWISALVQIAMRESGGNPRAINLWDSNAKAGHPSKGLMQTIDSTFSAYALPGHGDIWNPVDNAIAAIRYIQARYGTPFGQPLRGGYAEGGIRSATFDDGGRLMPGYTLAYNGTGRPEYVHPGGAQVVVNVSTVVQGHLYGDTHLKKTMKGVQDRQTSDLSHRVRRMMR